MPKINAAISEAQSQPWMMEPKALEAFCAKMAEIEINSISQIEVAAASRPQIKINGETAEIKISGVLMKSVPAWMKFFGLDATSYDEIIDQLNDALENENVKAINLIVDSPGGAVAGGAEAAAAIAEANKQKPVSAFVDDLVASGAYWLASQATSISAGINAKIGSIGVYSVVADYSKMAENAGIKVHIIRSGEHKGMGVIGAEITEKQISAYQSIIDGMAENFAAAVASGRKMESAKVKELATGQMWIAKDAKKLGLIDTIMNPAKNQNKNQINSSNSKGQEMSEQTNTNDKIDVDAIKKEAAAAATAASQKQLTDLKAAFPNDLSFAMAQFEKGATVTEAKAEYSEVLQTKLDASEKAKTEAAAAALKKKTEDAEALENGGEAGAGSGSDFMTEARALAKEEKIGITAAMQQLAKSNPDLHASYMDKCGEKKVKVSGKSARV